MAGAFGPSASSATGVPPPDLVLGGGRGGSLPAVAVAVAVVPAHCGKEASPKINEWLGPGAPGATFVGDASES